MAETVLVQPPASLPQDLFLDFDAEEEMEPVSNGGKEVERDGATSPQFSTTSTVSGELDDTSSNDIILEQNEGGQTRVHQSNTNGKSENDIVVETAEGATVNGKKENVVATTTERWERFEPAPSQPSWETFEHSGENKKSSPNRATAQNPGTKPIAQSEDGTESGTVCAADALVSSGWTAMSGEGDDSLIQGGGGDVIDDEPNLPYRLTRSMRATTNRKVQIVDALKQQRRLSNTSLDRDPTSRGGGAGLFANEDELSRRYNVEREWQVFVKMNRKVPGTRTKWLPVSIQVKNGELVIKRSTPPSLSSSSPSTAALPPSPPIHEFRLNHNHTMTDPISRSYDRNTKLHQIKLRQTRIQEKRTLKRWLFVDHVTRVHTIVKIGCPDLSVIQSLSETICEAIRQLPVNRQVGVAYRMNEVFVDVKDQAEILMNCDGAVLERCSLNRIYLQAFISNLPQCRIVVNDIEALLLLGRGNMTTSMSRQVRLSDVVLHPCVDQTQYKSTRELVFTPIDGYPFEVLRASVEPYKSPPITVTALMDFNESRNTVSITAKFSVRKKFNVRLEPISDLMFKFPIPSSWSGLFLADTKFGGKRSVQSTSALRGSFRRKIRSSSAFIQVHMGSAKYESEHSAIVWRIGQYVRSDTPHTFRCDIQLKQAMPRPTITDEHCHVSYSIPGSSTGLEIRTFKAEGHNPERWVKYEILYKYKVQMFPDLSID